MPAPVIVLAPDQYRSGDGKTAHGLVRGSDRFDVRAVVDASSAGEDAGALLDGMARGIPVLATISEALEASGPGVEWAVVGVATHGGRLTATLRALLAECIERRLGVVNGLHEPVADDPQLGPLAARCGVEIIDVRKPPPIAELHFWQGSIASVRAPRVAVLGTDCSVGKRTTTRALTLALGRRGVRAQMIYTGQTGWMQGAGYGIVLDALPNDYVSGELEHAVVSCDRDTSPQVMLIEGQSALRNPSGPCGAELLLSAAAHHVIVQHAPGRRFFEGHEDYAVPIPALADEQRLIRMYGAEVIAVALSEESASEDEMRAHQQRLEMELALPVVRPLSEGVERLADAVEACIADVGSAPR